MMNAFPLYRKMAAIAYRQVANSSIALLCHFLPPGIKEAICVIDGLLKSTWRVASMTLKSEVGNNFPRCVFMLCLYSVFRSD
jgi:hypothetical protein